MDTAHSYKKINSPKIVDTVNFKGKYIDATVFRSKVITVSAISAFLASFAAFIIILLT